MNKIFIISSDIAKRKQISDLLETQDENMQTVKRFINDEEYKDCENVDNLYYLDNKTITTSLKNNSILYISTINGYNVGVTFDEFYNSSIVHLSLSDFNNISVNFLEKHKSDIFIVWVDTQIHENKQLLKQEICEANYLMEKLENYHYIYMLNESIEDIVKIIFDYCYGDPNTQADILTEYC